MVNRLGTDGRYEALMRAMHRSGTHSAIRRAAAARAEQPGSGTAPSREIPAADAIRSFGGAAVLTTRRPHAVSPATVQTQPGKPLDTLPTTPVTDQPSALTEVGDETTPWGSNGFSVALELRIRIQLNLPPPSATATAAPAPTLPSGGDTPATLPSQPPEATLPSSQPGAQPGTQPDTPTNTQPGTTNTDLQRQLKLELRSVGKEVRAALRDLLHSRDLSADARTQIRELAKQFRRDVRDALSNASQNDQFDPDALMAGVRQALDTLVNGLQTLATQLSGGSGTDQPGAQQPPTGQQPAPSQPPVTTGDTPTIIPVTPPRLQPGDPPWIVPVTPPRLQPGDPPWIVPVTPPRLQPGFLAGLLPIAVAQLQPGQLAAGYSFQYNIQIQGRLELYA
jgi:hypothetical protein